MFIIFDILFTIVPVVIIITFVVFAIKSAKTNKRIRNSDEFKEIFDKIERENKQLNNEDLTDEEIEEELVKRFNAYSPEKNNNIPSQPNHDDTCNEKACDGCGAEDVYAQVYGKRKKNKLKK